jgi:ADP-ribose pyrophosphatase YjhB (NUDIX family)
MHFIQKHILDRLRETGAMRYSVLQPDGIESSHFRYHLKELEREQYVTSPERGVYRLTTKGQHLVDRLSRHTTNFINMPKVITYCLLTQGSSYLLQRKNRDPYRGFINMISGKVHEDETTIDACRREVQEKAGIEISAPVLKGIFEIIIRSGGKLLTHTIAYAYTAEALEDVRRDHDLLAIDRADLTNTPELAPDTVQIITSLPQQGLQVDTLSIEFELHT